MQSRDCNGSAACRFRATTMDLAEWLRGLGLEQYVPAFRDNDIDGEVLRRLTADDLRELGVLSIGHRRRLLDAITALGTIESSPRPSYPLRMSAAAPSPLLPRMRGREGWGRMPNAGN